MDKLKDARELIMSQPDMLWCRWYGLNYDNKSVFTRLDKTLLFLAFEDRGVPKYMRIIGYPENNRDINNGEERIRYTSEITYRITSPGRRGKIMPLDYVRENESCEVSGIHKYMYYGEESHKFSSKREGDTFMMKLLSGIEDAESTRDMVYPEFYLCMSQDRFDVCPRKNEQTHTYLSEFPGFDNREPIQINMEKLRDNISVFAGTDKKGNRRWGFPYRYFHGKGVKACSQEFRKGWFKIPKAECNIEEPHIVFDLIEEDSL